MPNPRLKLALLALLLVVVPQTGRAQYTQWKHKGVVWILTMPEGASLPDGVEIKDFPLLVRLNRDFFDFTQAKPDGGDLRVASDSGSPLAYQIEEWDAGAGRACIWVRVPRILGNARQAITLFWGNPGATSESNGGAVFNASNGYLSVWHMSDPVEDATGTLPCKDTGTTATAGIIGQARHFPGGKGIFCGDKIAGYPSGASPHSTEAWFRADQANPTLLAWGNEGGGQGTKVRLQLRSPPHIHIDSDFADAKGNERLRFGQWIHVAYTYDGGQGRIYINGKLDTAGPQKLAIKSPSRLWLGGWYGNYDFVGDLDEVRISNIARSADWVKLEYENQQPQQTLVGPIVQKEGELSVSPNLASLDEGKTLAISAQAGGAEKIYWIVRRQGSESIAAVDHLHFAFDAGRVEKDEQAQVILKAIYPNQIQSKTIAIDIRKTIPDPIFSIEAPAKWDGRTTIEIVPRIANLSQLQAHGMPDLHYRWRAGGMATVHHNEDGKFILTRAMNSGQLNISLALDNGGSKIVQACSIAVTESAHDAWIEREAAADEKPQEGQFFARDDSGRGMLHYNGKLSQPAELVFLKLYANDKLIDTQTQPPGKDASYSLTARLDPGMIQYRIEFGTRSASADKVLDAVGDLVCGDAFLIDGQSNAVATEFGKAENPPTSPWIRTFGSPEGGNEGRLKLWGSAVARAPAGKLQIGYWAMILAQRLVESQQVPICIINGAVGGTRIDQHQRNPADPEDLSTIYGRLLWRVRQARLTHGIRGIFWHQGENDQGADGPSGGFGWETYQDYFLQMAAAWQQDYPNVRHFYIFQIWPRACSMGIGDSDDMLREIQRELPDQFSNMSIMSTLGVTPGGTCHYPPQGYADIAKLIEPLVERYNYGNAFATPITPPNLRQARFSTSRRDEIELQFDQPVVWTDSLKNQFMLDGAHATADSGVTAGNVLTLRWKLPTSCKTIGYIDGRNWDPDNVLRGKNGIAALTFYNVPVRDAEDAAQPRSHRAAEQ